MMNRGSTQHRKTMNTIQASPTSDYKIDFLQFAPEIRNQIYDLVFVKPTYVGSASSRHVVRTKDFYKDARVWRSLAFAMTCRQIYEESANIFYAKNGFEFYYVRPFLEFLEGIGIQRRALLTKLRYHQHENGAPFIVCRYLKSCTNLKDLEIFARVATETRAKFYWEYPLKDSMDFFLNDKTKIEFGEPLTIGKPRKPSLEAPRMYGCAPFELPRINHVHCHKFLVALALNHFAKSLEHVKSEEEGTYKRRDLPNVFQDKKRCAWFYSNRQQKIKAKFSKPAGVDLTKDDAPSRQNTISRSTGSALQRHEKAARIRETQASFSESVRHAKPGGSMMTAGSLNADRNAFEAEKGFEDEDAPKDDGLGLFSARVVGLADRRT